MATERFTVVLSVTVPEGEAFDIIPDLQDLLAEKFPNIIGRSITRFDGVQAERARDFADDLVREWDC